MNRDGVLIPSYQAIGKSNICVRFK